MNKTVLKKTIGLFLTGLSFCTISGTLLAEETVKAPSKGTMDECSKELLLAYFPKAFVDETLKKFNVSQDHWEAINRDLAEKDKDIVKMVEEKASKMNPNPLKDPQQRQAAVKIFRETLLQVFSDAMKANGVTDEKQIQSMLDDVQQQKAKRFAMCMEKHKEAYNDSDNDRDNDSETEEEYENNAEDSNHSSAHNSQSAEHSHVH